MAKKVLVAIPLGMLEQMDLVARFEHRNRSDLIREALRRYVDQFKMSYSPPPGSLSKSYRASSVAARKSSEN